MQEKGILPTVRRNDFSVFDIGAGQGYLPGLLEKYIGRLVLLEPNPRCVEVLTKHFDPVYPYPWDDSTLERVRQVDPRGFDLIIMSHMLYHFNGIDDIRRKIRMALTLLKTAGHLAIIINQPSAPTAGIGIAFQLEEGRLDESTTNQDLHTLCHDSRFYRELSHGKTDVAIYPIDTPISQVKTREELMILFRMPLLNPLSDAPCATDKLDDFITRYLDLKYPGLTFPVTIPSQDDLIIIRKKATGSPTAAGQTKSCQKKK